MSVCCHKMPGKHFSTNLSVNNDMRIFWPPIRRHVRGDFIVCNVMVWCHFSISPKAYVYRIRSQSYHFSRFFPVGRNSLCFHCDPRGCDHLLLWSLKNCWLNQGGSVEAKFVIHLNCAYLDLFGVVTYSFITRDVQLVFKMWCLP